MENIMNSPAYKAAREKAQELLEKLTLTEKIGQLSQFGNSIYSSEEKKYEDHFREGKVGSFLTLRGAERTNKIQSNLLSIQRTPIPAIFADDVIHGYRTTFPTPIAQSCSWDPELTTRCDAAAAKEAYAGGLKWTFGPMVDIARDPRWGRIMEGFGEDTYLCSQFAAAAVKGFQGEGDAPGKDHLLACMKHYAAYGACVGGRDYNTADVSLETLHEVYLPPFKAGIDAGAATVMSAFNDVNGVPATANHYLLSDVLRSQFGFKGFVVSDAGAVGELIAHGFAADPKDAVLKAFGAGVDMLMAGDMFNDNIPSLLEEGKIAMEDIDRSVLSILTLKYLLGLFDEPYVDPDGENVFFCAEHLALAREAGAQCAVLLENNGILPLKNVKNIALTGPLTHPCGQAHLLGGWCGIADPSRTVTIEDGLRAAIPDANIDVIPGATFVHMSKEEIDAIAVRAAGSDVIIAVVGEENGMAGEAGSKADLNLCGSQEELVLALCATGKPVICLVSAGRPLVLSKFKDKVAALLNIWQPGTEAGNSVADLLTGRVDPSGHLTTSFPYTVGQVPIYYNHPSTGRPATGRWRFESKYMDCPIAPLYPFGYGMSYTSFEYSDISLSSDVMPADGELKVSLTVTNTGNYDGAAVVQLYVRDLVASRVRPVKELKGFKKLFLAKGASSRVELSLPAASLAFVNSDLEWVVEPGQFMLWVSEDSTDERYGFDFEVI
ncbi:MAG: beta-glucosidase BglX [Clostridia bacterium]|nr:beta-glucosidase BglX [Clostridia bacterium]